MAKLAMGTDFLCQSCSAEDAKSVKAREQEAKIRLAELQERAKTVILTTTHTIEGSVIAEYLGIESVEIVLGTGMFSEFQGGLADMFGQRSTGFEEKIQNAKKTACELLQMRAAQRGANAVVGVDMDFTEFSGNRIGVILNGTLVKVLHQY